MKKFYLMIFAVVTLAGMLAISGCKKKETYTVTFNANGGIGTMAAQTFTEGESQALTRNAFTYDGYTFNGWNTMSNGSGASYPDGYTLTVTSDMTLYAQWTSNGTNPTSGQGTLNGHNWVDLGLPSGTKWATCNVGAATPDGYGDYFAWGETTPKTTYNWSTYRYSNGGYTSLTKYCNKENYGIDGFTDNLTTLEVSDDAATAKWGAGWRIPTQDEIQELIDNCNLTWTTQNNIKGMLVTSSSNGNSIFLPVAGSRIDNELDDDGIFGNYWSSSLATDEPDGAWNLRFNSEDDYYLRYDQRLLGFSIRPVCASQN